MYTEEEKTLFLDGLGSWQLATTTATGDGENLTAKT